jgi:tetratricopeptide (TPR) repeat protein
MERIAKGAPILAFVVGALLLSCAAPGFNVKVLRPAEINLAGIDKIAIGSIEGPANAEVAEALATSIFNSGRYEVLDRQHLYEIFQEHRLSFSGMVDQETAVEIGKLVGSAALVFGRVSTHKYSEDMTHYDGKDKKGRSYRVYTRKGQGQVSMTLQVTDLRTGKIVAIKQLSDTQGAKKSATNDYPEKIDSKSLLARARENCVVTFMKAIAPYEVSERVSFEKDKEIPEIERGITLAKTGDLWRASGAFQKAVQENPTSPKAHFNLGIAYMCLGDYGEAIQVLDKAYSMAPSKKYASELARAKRWKADAEKVESQVQARQ